MRMHVLGSIALSAIVVLATSARADVRVTIADGHVTVSAKDATVRQILAEWARVGQARIVNAERLAGPPISLELTNVPEAQALDTLLRTVSGYLAAPRAVAVPNASLYDRVFVLPTSNAAPPRAAAAPPPTPAFTPPAFAPDQAGDEIAVPGVNQRQNPAQPNAAPNGQPNGPGGQPNGPPRGPIFNAFPQAPTAQGRPVAPPGAPVSSPVPTGPVGVSTPGMVTPAPQPQQQLGKPEVQQP